MTVRFCVFDREKGCMSILIILQAKSPRRAGRRGDNTGSGLHYCDLNFEYVNMRLCECMCGMYGISVNNSYSLFPPLQIH